MNEYYFLFALAGIWMLFAAVHDFKTREVPNWLNFSLIALALAYRAFYSISWEDALFFIYGIIGVMVFTALGFAFYYGRAFGGGDAKLLMAVGAILPFQAFDDFIFLSAWFVFILFGIGALYSFAYSIFLIRGNGKKMIRKFSQMEKNRKAFAFGILFIGVIAGIVFFFLRNAYIGIGFIILGIAPLLYFYAKIFDEVCMVKKLKPGELREGDWLVSSIKAGKHKIEKTVHGLSSEDIRILKKYNKSVFIRDGLPFTINFLLALMVFFFLFLLKGFSFSSLL